MTCRSVVARRLECGDFGLALAVTVFVEASKSRARIAVLATFAQLFVVGSALAEPTNGGTVARASAADAPASAAPAEPDEPSRPQAADQENDSATPLPGPELAPSSEATPVVVDSNEQHAAQTIASPSPALVKKPAAAADDTLRAKPRKPEWYGWQTLTSDAASLAIVLVQGGGAAYKLGLAGYLAVPPVIHFAHGNRAQSLESFGLRVLAPTAGALLGFVGGSLACRGDLDCALLPTAVGSGIGAVTAVVLDSTLLAVKGPPRRYADVRLRWRPIVMAGKNDARIGIAGSF